MRSLLLRVSAALVLAQLTVFTTPAVHGHRIPWKWNTHLRSEMHLSWTRQSDSPRLQDQLWTPTSEKS